MSKKRIRLVDIAAKAEVSVMSVSHVLNGTGKGRVSVSEEKAEHIRKIAKQLEYTPNYAARALRGSSIQMIGAVAFGAMDPVRVRAIAYLQQEAAKYEYHVMSTVISNSSVGWETAVRALLSHGVNALVAFCDSQEEIEQAMALGAEEGVPVLPIRLDGGKIVAFHGKEAVGIEVDVFTGVKLMANAMNCESVNRLEVLYTEKELMWMEIAKKALAEQACSVSFGKISDEMLENGELQIKRLTGVLCSSDYIASQLVRSNPDLMVGDDYQVIGWGNAMACHYTNPRLSSIGLDLPKVMEIAVQDIVNKKIEGVRRVEPILLTRETSKEIKNS